ncbi:hypothetical protein [Roseovarius sp. MMSF_3281]|nr:hypothetical protein [Roseovarius sp. MMSF_3281]
MAAIQKLFQRIKHAFAEIDHGFSLMYGLSTPEAAPKTTQGAK